MWASADQGVRRDPEPGKGETTQQPERNKAVRTKQCSRAGDNALMHTPPTLPPPCPSHPAAPSPPCHPTPRVNTFISLLVPP